MDYYQGVVTEYLRADRAIFLNTEFCLQKNEGDNPDTNGLHWYVDAVAADFRTNTVFLCEISFAKGLSSLIKRLSGWDIHWLEIKDALARDAHLPSDWQIRPWLFVPESHVSGLVKKLAVLKFDAIPELGKPRITTLEMTQPWRYRSWNRKGEAAKPDIIPENMRE